MCRVSGKKGVHDPYVIDVVFRERLKVILSLKFGVEPFDKYGASLRSAGRETTLGGA